MPNEGHERPTVRIVITRISERWHSAQADAVLDGVVKLATGHLLRVLLSHVWRARIHRLAVHGVSAADIGMAGGAVVCPVRHPFVDHFRSGRNGVLHGLVARWNGSPANRGGQCFLHEHWFGARAETALQHVVHLVSAHAQSTDDKQKQTDSYLLLHGGYSGAPPVFG